LVSYLTVCFHRALTIPCLASWNADVAHTHNSALVPCCRRWMSDRIKKQSIIGCITGKPVFCIPSVLPTPCLVGAHREIQTHEFTNLPFFVEMKEVWKLNETSKKPPQKIMTFKKLTKCKQQSTCFWSLVNLNKYPDEQSGTCTYRARQARWMATAGLSVVYVAMRLAIRSSCLVDSDPANDWSVASSDALSLCASSITQASDSPTCPYWKKITCSTGNI